MAKKWTQTRMYQGSPVPTKKGVRGPDPTPTPRFRSKVGGVSGTGMGKGFGSGHEGKLRRGPHPHAPKQG
jgi:hypothetical protein